MDKPVYFWSWIVGPYYDFHWIDNSGKLEFCEAIHRAVGKLTLRLGTTETH